MVRIFQCSSGICPPGFGVWGVIQQLGLGLCLSLSYCNSVFHIHECVFQEEDFPVSSYTALSVAQCLLFRVNTGTQWAQVLSGVSDGWASPGASRASLHDPSRHCPGTDTEASRRHWVFPRGRHVGEPPRGRPWPLSCSLGGHCPGGRQNTQVSEHEQGGFCLSPALPPRTSSPPVPRLSSESSWGNNAFFALSV